MRSCSKFQLLISLSLCPLRSVTSPLQRHIAYRPGWLNITVAFFPKSEEPACQGNNIANAVSLTTDNIPEAYTCFNLPHPFNQRSNYSYQDVWKSGPARQLNYTSGNAASFNNNNTNYTSVWYDLRSQGQEKPGANSPWAFHIYAFSDCIQNGGDDYPLEDFPWFETSCQSKAGGQCRVVPQQIKSPAINKATKYNQMHGKCEVWAGLGASPASMLNRRTPAIAVVAAAVAVFLVM